MPQDFVIKTANNTYRIRAAEGTTQEQAVSLAAATNPQFAQEYSQSQARQSLASSVGREESNDPFAQMQPPDIEALTNAVGPMVGAGLGIKSLTRAIPRVLRGPGATGDISINPATMATRELEAVVPRNPLSTPPTPELGSPENPGWMSKLPTRMPKQSAPLVSDVSASAGPYRGPASVPKPVMPQAELGSPENPGLMSKIPTGRGSMPVPSKPEVSDLAVSSGPYRGPGSVPKPLAELGSQENPGWYSELPKRMPEPQVSSLTESSGPYRGPSSAPPSVSPVNVSSGPYRGPFSVSQSRSLSMGTSAQPGRLSLPSIVPEAESVPGAGGESWSMERKTSPQLQRAVTAGDPGAIRTAMRLDPTYRPVIQPKPTVGTTDPEFTGMRERLFGELGYKSSQLTSSEESIPQGNPTPFSRNFPPRVKRPPEETQ